ncbi:Transducin beta protein 2 [Trichostrongylus colubriformis]|uniref:Transducin beta protein 2 n=1 Tax=Trichostrongylus colubriformis TaxID=6319 RepID=A0AAN8FU46_TRICO
MMMNFEKMDMPTMISAFVGILVIMISSILYFAKKQSEEEPHEEEEDKAAWVVEGTDEGATLDATRKANKHRKNDHWKPKVKDASYDHPWSVTTLKGHTADVTGMDFAQDGKKFVTVSTDRAAFLWDVRDFEEREHKSVRQILDFDTATQVSFSPDCKSVVFAMKRSNKLSVFKLMKKEAGGTYKFVHVENVSFPSAHTLDISHSSISSTGKFLMSASPDNKIVLYDIHGNILKTLEPKGETRFVAACGFTTEVFVYEVIFNRENVFQDAKRAFDLKGHNSGVFAVAFNASASRAVTVSRDGFWRVFDTDVRYAQGQDAGILNKGEWSELKGASADRVRLAMSPSGDSFAVSCGSTLKIFSSEDEHKDFPELNDVHGDQRILVIKYSSCGRLVATCGDRYVRVFRNVPEYHSQVVRLSKNLKDVSGDAPKRRMLEQIEEAKQVLQKYCV